MVVDPPRPPRARAAARPRWRVRPRDVDVLPRAAGHLATRAPRAAPTVTSLVVRGGDQPPYETRRLGCAPGGDAYLALRDVVRIAREAHAEIAAGYGEAADDGEGHDFHGFRFVQLPISLAMPEAWRELWQPLPASEEVGLARRAQHAARARAPCSLPAACSALSRSARSRSSARGAAARALPLSLSRSSAKWIAAAALSLPSLLHPCCQRRRRPEEARATAVFQPPTRYDPTRAAWSTPTRARQLVPLTRAAAALGVALVSSRSIDGGGRAAAAPAAAAACALEEVGLASTARAGTSSVNGSAPGGIRGGGDGGIAGSEEEEDATSALRGAPALLQLTRSIPGLSIALVGHKVRSEIHIETAAGDFARWWW